MYRILIFFKGAQVVNLALEANRCTPAVAASAVHTSVACGIVRIIFAAGNPLHTGAIHKVNGLLHVFPANLLLQAAAALCSSG